MQYQQITRVPTDYALRSARQIAVSDTVLCYGLKQGHIRVLSRYSEARALLKGHTAVISDLRFLDPENGGLLASAAPDGRVFAWQLTVRPQIRICLTLSSQPSPIPGSQWGRLHAVLGQHGTA
jgi:enhancer of mRNA-decapping protein 4